jgi:hypothetical protein
MIGGFEPFKRNTFVRCYLLSNTRNNDMHFCIPAENLEQAPGIASTACTSNADYKLFYHLNLALSCDTNVGVRIKRVYAGLAGNC